MHRDLLSPLAALALAVPVAAQCSTSPFAGAPLTLSVAADPAVPFDGAELYHKADGFRSTPPPAWSALRAVPDFRLGPVFRACGAQPFPDVDAVSHGEDWILADDATGRIAVPRDRWGGLVFSVTPATVGRAGSAIRSESNSAGGAAGDLFGFMLPGSTLPPALIGVTQRAHDSREVDLGPAAADVDAVDVPLPMWRLQPGIRAAMLAPPRLFFSVSNATLGRVPASWWAGTTPSGATIFQVVWSASNASWSCPRVWKTWSDLGLLAHEDLDALAVDMRNERILFSTTTRTRDPILFLYCGTDLANPVPYSDAQGVPVSDQAGLINDDDIDAICALDPSVRASSTGLNAFGFAMGTPLPKLGLFPAADVASSAFRVFDGGVDAWRAFVSGWPAGAERMPGVAVLLLSIPQGPPGFLAVAVVPRDPADPVCGAPESATIAVPPAVDLTGTQVDLHWFVADQGVQAVGEAWPIRVRL
jgi:hypothetical protein